ncbi:hypothetical protein LRY65_00720 [Candidatus Woesebacteria bacterium]|nr:hypothetical protein [Candidatus Woesebacteria bacterium]MCD8546536.1 hypothetical protein [Candidatus Woesebacteria bacterium]
MEEKYKYFVDQILTWHQHNGRHNLPWRKPNITPYEVWVSEVMLQQTQVNRVIPYYTNFLERFPTVKHLAEATWEEFLPYYQGLGYYNRGRNMLKTAQIVVNEFGGEFPTNKTALKKLPGIGEYTATAILSFGLQEPHLAFDTNHQRVWGRYLHGDKKAELDPLEIESNLPPNTDFKKLNAAIMDFANLVYTNRNPDIENSPLQPYCVFCQTGGRLESTSTSKKSDFPTSEAQTFLILHEQHKKYFSTQKRTYAPFILPAPLNTRARIQSYFEREHGLQLSVRPPYKKAYVDGVPTLFTRAQILLGEHEFSEFPKKEVTAWLKTVEDGTIESS